MSDFALFNLDAEQAVIGGLLIENEALDRIAFLNPEHFGSDAYRTLFVTIRHMLNTGKPADLVTLAEELGSRLDELGGIMELGGVVRDTPSAANIRHYAERVVEKSRQRELLAAIARISDLAHGAGNVTEKINQAQAEIMRLTDTKSNRDPKSLREILSPAVETIDHRFTQQGCDGLMTGMKDLDAKLSGLKNGDMVIIAGRPAMGKTTLAVQIALHAAQSGKPALVLSQEMSYQQLADRLLSSSGKIYLGDITTGKLTDDGWARLSAAVGNLIDLPLYLDDQGALALADVCAKARMIKRKHGLSLVVVDYLQLMSGVGNNRNAQIEEISRGLKALAKELHIPIIVLSQLSRECEKRNNKRPMMSDLRDSGAIEQDADLILFVYRDEIYNSDSPDKGTVEIIIGKNRQGEPGAVRMSFQGEFSNFADLAHNWTPASQIKKRRGFSD